MHQAVSDLDQIKRSSYFNLIRYCRTLFIFLGNQLRDEIHKWLSPPDPSTNHGIACSTHHKKTAPWFFQGRIYQEWKSKGSLLWVHGKRSSCFAFHPILPPHGFLIVAGSGKSVLWFVDFSLFLLEVADVSYQFHRHTRYQGHVRGRKCINGVFLF